MRLCERCGIEFDGASAWCADCREVEGVEIHWPVLSDFKPALLEAQWALVKPFYQEGKYDQEIADELGVTMNMVRRVRSEMGKPANKRADRYLPKDENVIQERLNKMNQARHNTKRGSLGRHTSNSGQ